MKKSIYILPFLFFATSIAIAQLPSDYPFKTLVDNENYLIVTGYDYNNDLFVEKYPQGNTNYIWHQPYANIGNDRGMDVATDNLENVFACGYTYNSIFNNNDIRIIKFRRNNGLFFSESFPAQAQA